MGMRMKLTENDGSTTPSLALPPEGRGDACSAARVRDGSVVMVTSHIRNTPKRVGSTGALSAAESDRPSTVRVSAGSMMPSSHSRAVA